GASWFPLRGPDPQLSAHHAPRAAAIHLASWHQEQCNVPLQCPDWAGARRPLQHFSFRVTSRAKGIKRYRNPPQRVPASSTQELWSTISLPWAIRLLMISLWLAPVSVARSAMLTSFKMIF